MCTVAVQVPTAAYSGLLKVVLGWKTLKFPENIAQAMAPEKHI